jgi:hypothetical protein
MDTTISDPFVDLICADDEWLRDEFDAIIAESWDIPADPPPPPAEDGRPAERNPGASPPVAATPCLAPPPARWSTHRKARSPPPAGYSGISRATETGKGR